jgi:hypothetical protein
LYLLSSQKQIHPQQQAHTMIDTIVLTLSSSTYRITNPDAFGLSPRIIGGTGRKTRDMALKLQPNTKRVACGYI